MITRVLHRGLTAFALVVLATFAAHADDAFAPPADLDEGWYARIETSMGEILARLHPETAPQAVAHFAALAEGKLEWHDPITGESKKSPYYDGIEVHFARAGHLFEAGLRPGTQYPPEIWVPFEGREGKPFGRPGRLGLIAKPPGISGAVFFITAAPDRKLDSRFPCFGTVISDLEVVYRITEVKTRPGGHPIDPVRIEKVRIFSVGSPAALPAPVPFVPRRKALEDDG